MTPAAHLGPAAGAPGGTSKACPKAASRWTEEHDRFVHAYFDAVGAGIGPRDLGRSETAVTARAALLKRTGAWDALDRAERAREDYRRCLGLPATFEEAMETRP